MPWPACRSRRSTGCRARCAQCRLAVHARDDLQTGDRTPRRREACHARACHRVIEHQEIEIWRLVRGQLLGHPLGVGSIDAAGAPPARRLPRARASVAAISSAKRCRSGGVLSKHHFENGDRAAVPREDAAQHVAPRSLPHRRVAGASTATHSGNVCGGCGVQITIERGPSRRAVDRWSVASRPESAAQARAVRSARASRD